MSKIIIYTDGSSRGNPGPGGYGAVLIAGDKRKEISQGYTYTTNNRMELMSAIAALECLKNDNNDVTIYSDSKYVVDSVEMGWLKNWVIKNFKGIKNPDLWKRFLITYKRQNVKFIWVKGHASNVGNERCDVLATTAAQSSNLILDEGYQKS
jgi:ribonuclease HI